jgi:hypothetical protein
MHEPGPFTVVTQTDRTVVLFAMCTCGDDDCGFSVTAAIEDAVKV